MVKLIGAALILFAGTMIGFMQASRFASRPRQIRQLGYALQRLETEIGYGYTPLPEAIGRCAAHLSEPAAALLRGVNQRLSEGNELTFKECWEQSVTAIWPGTAMKAAEQSALIRLGATLGISDREDQIKHLRLAMQQLKAEEDTARDDQARYEKMWKSLGVLIAALVVILIV
ncbi:stage III sporulation protein AB [Paenibacillus baekrokdamisoli]|uniref:Stage III sporulation protein AB n=1 Tax=Paenibacillus baekrokdamisoli TaxID=1712516 RepID=A0A3G9IQI3_9BACL|nr:stage III sporulation protein SpoIIIAB [Paenibacillus baekrokdamisoli]MBB3070108.1 stage III sporulation protein AB [Paenibacillus baekrokdamisoli]BBH21120.1 stage III sporulation protein AB [Paenibacillus baekrokdamisoli]